MVWTQITRQKVLARDRHDSLFVPVALQGSWQKGKKLGSGMQSSSRMIASGTFSKTHLSPLDSRSRRPRFSSEYSRRTVQGH